MDGSKHHGLGGERNPVQGGVGEDGDELLIVGERCKAGLVDLEAASAGGGDHRG